MAAVALPGDALLWSWQQAHGRSWSCSKIQLNWCSILSLPLVWQGQSSEWPVGEEVVQFGWLRLRSLVMHSLWSDKTPVYLLTLRSWQQSRGRAGAVLKCIWNWCWVQSCLCWTVAGLSVCRTNCASSPSAQTATFCGHSLSTMMGPSYCCDRSRALTISSTSKFVWLTIVRQLQRVMMLMFASPSTTSSSPQCSKERRTLPMSGWIGLSAAPPSWLSGLLTGILL